MATSFFCLSSSVLYLLAINAFSNTKWIVCVHGVFERLYVASKKPMIWMLGKLVFTWFESSENGVKTKTNPRCKQIYECCIYIHANTDSYSTNAWSSVRFFHFQYIRRSSSQPCPCNHIVRADGRSFCAISVASNIPHFQLLHKEQVNQAHVRSNHIHICAGKLMFGICFIWNTSISRCVRFRLLFLYVMFYFCRILDERAILATMFECESNSSGRKRASKHQSRSTLADARANHDPRTVLHPVLNTKLLARWL